MAISLAYFSIPLTLATFARRRRDLVFRPMFWLFAASILLCDAGHWLDMLTLWVPAYGAEVVVEAGVEVGARCRIGPEAAIGEGVVLGPDCRIGAHAA